MSNFALRMKELRKERKLKQQELADEFSVKLRTYQGYEYGESYPEVAKLLAIADFFDVSLDYLMGRSDDATPPILSDEEQTELALNQVAEDLREYVLKYCRLDQYGREAVESIIRAEYNRCRAQGELGPTGDYAVNIRIIS